MYKKPEFLHLVVQSLAARGFYYTPTFSQESADVIELARALGIIFVPQGVDSDLPLIQSAPAANASYLAPFDCAMGIGWHNDFSTHAKRPVLSLAYLQRVDPRWPDYGAWRVATSDMIFDRLCMTAEGHNVIQFLLDNELPYSFTGHGDPVLFKVIERRNPMSNRLSLRFYGRALRDGANLLYGKVAKNLEDAFTLIETIADQVGHTFAAPAGALLITDNWHSLHDRTLQSIDPDGVRPPFDVH